MAIDSKQPLRKITQVELIYRNKVRAADRPKIASASDAYNLLIGYWDMNKIELVEQFKILLLDRNNACMGIAEISTGGISSCSADPRIVFATALKARATRIVLAHNHPSQKLNPSTKDITLTQQLCRAGEALDIEVSDHLIVSQYDYYSIMEGGLIL